MKDRDRRTGHFDAGLNSRQSTMRDFSAAAAMTPTCKSEHYIETYQAENGEAIDGLRRDTNRKVVVPSPSDLNRAQAVFRSEVEAWSAVDSRNRQLLAKVEAELGTLRAGSVGRR